MLAAWGVDGHNSHTNICSSGARAGYHLWMGMDRPSPDHTHARVILLVSSHLETGHYFNPHAQRIIDAKAGGAKLVVLDTRLSNTATHADHWLSPYPGSEAAIFLSIARWLVANRLHDRDFVRRWWNWREFMAQAHPDLPPDFERFEERARGDVRRVHLRVRGARIRGGGGHDRGRLPASWRGAGTRLSTHNWRSAAAGNLGGWQVARTLFLLNALMGAVATEGGTHPNSWNKFVPASHPSAPAPGALERAHLACRVSACADGDVLPAAASSEEERRFPRRLLHARVQPGLDQPGRFLLDRDAHRPGSGSACTSP